MYFPRHVSVYLGDVLVFSGPGKVQGERRGSCQSLWKQQLQDGPLFTIIIIIQITNWHMYIDKDISTEVGVKSKSMETKVDLKTVPAFTFDHNDCH